MSLNASAMITLYNPNMDTVKRLCLQIVGVFNEVIIVDNSEVPAKIPDELEGVITISKGNVGVSGAINLALDLVSNESNYLMIFDQDSYVDSVTVNRLLDLAFRNNVTICSLNPVDQAGSDIHAKFFDRFPTRIIDGEVASVVYATQFSGLLINLRAFSEVGRIDEKFFLNFADTEWCVRASSKGYNIYVFRGLKMIHEFGEGKKKIGPVEISYGAPFRLYYSSRDALRLSLYSHVGYKLKAKLLGHLLLHFCAIPFLDKKLDRINFFMRGFLDFFRGRCGQIK